MAGRVRLSRRVIRRPAVSAGSPWRARGAGGPGAAGRLVPAFRAAARGRAGCRRTGVNMAVSCLLGRDRGSSWYACSPCQHPVCWRCADGVGAGHGFPGACARPGLAGRARPGLAGGGRGPRFREGCGWPGQPTDGGAGGPGGDQPAPAARGGPGGDRTVQGELAVTGPGRPGVSRGERALQRGRGGT